MNKDEGITRSNADKKEKLSQKEITEGLNNRSGEFVKLLRWFEKRNGSKFVKAENISDQKTHQRDQKLYFQNGTEIPLELRISGEGTDLNSTINQMKNDKILDIPGYDKVLEEYRTIHRPRSLSALATLTNKTFINSLDGKAMTDVENVLYENRKQIPEIMKFCKEAWNIILDVENFSVCLLCKNPIKQMFDNFHLPKYIYLKETNEILQIDEEFLLENKTFSSKSDGKNFEILDENGEELFGFTIHWKNCIGVKTPCINGWRSSKLYIREKLV